MLATRLEFLKISRIKSKDLSTYIKRGKVAAEGGMFDTENRTNKSFIDRGVRKYNTLPWGLKRCYKCRFIKIPSDFKIKKDKRGVRSSSTCNYCLSKKQEPVLIKKYNKLKSVYKEAYKNSKTLSHCLGCKVPIKKSVKRCNGCKKLHSKNKSKEQRRRHHEKQKVVQKNWRDRNKPYINNFIKEKMKKDHVFKFTRQVRTLITESFKRRDFKKCKKTITILGCDIPFFKSHIESLFKPGMNWENRKMWHIDHKTPLVTAKTVEDLIKLNHYTNLQPLWAIENLKKGGKIASIY